MQNQLIIIGTDYPVCAWKMS